MFGLSQLISISSTAVNRLFACKIMKKFTDVKLLSYFSNPLIQSDLRLVALANGERRVVDLGDSDSVFLLLLA